MDEPPPERVIEPEDLQTLWVTDCIAVGVISGVLVISLAEKRFALGSGHAEASEVQKHVVTRLAMTPASFNDMVSRAATLGVRAARRRPRPRALN